MEAGTSRRPSGRGSRQAGDPPPGPIRVVLIEDSRLARDQLVALLDAQPHLEVVGTAPSAATGLTQVQESRPDVALVDAALADHDCHRWFERARTGAPGARVVLMNVRPARDDIVGFIEAGANGFILSDADADEIVGTIRRVAQGVAVLPAPLTSTLFSHFAGHAAVRTAPEAPGASVHLTTREREIIELIAGGLANKEIARRLGITTHTVKCHVHHILGKLDLHSRLQLAAHAHHAAARPSEL